MSNKTQLQTNNTSLSALTDRINAAKEAVGNIPVVSGATIQEVDVTIKTRTMPTSSSFVESIFSVASDEEGLYSNSVSNAQYFQIITPVVGTLIFIKTINSPTKCLINSSFLELVSFDSTKGAVIKVNAVGVESGISITLS